MCKTADSIYAGIAVTRIDRYLINNESVWFAKCYVHCHRASECILSDVLYAKRSVMQTDHRIMEMTINAKLIPSGRIVLS